MKGLAVGSVLLFIGTCIIPATVQNIKKPSYPTLRGIWLYVGGSGPGNYTKIQDAIDDVSDGDNIFVFNGTYYENIFINKEIRLLGADKNNTIIDGSSNNESIIIIQANNVYIGNFTIRNSSSFYRGIFFQQNYDGSSIIDNIIKNIRGALVLSNSRHLNISRNIIINNYINPAVDLINSSDNIISRNIVLHTSEYSSDSISLIANSNNNTIIGNTIDSGDFGIDIAFSSNYNKIYKNSIRKCHYGIDLSGAYYNEISSNTITENDLGIFLVWYTDHNTINNNTILNNINGIRAETTSNSSNNTIYHNNFLNNTLQAYVSNSCSNKWDNGYPSCGNYWDDYSGVDNFSGPNQNLSDCDGIGDTPYLIPSGDNKDTYPLMEPYGMTALSFEFRSGFFKNSGSIKNIGNATAFYVHWSIIVDGRMVFIGRESSGTLAKPLLPGEEAYTSSKFIVGFGSIILTVAVWADNAPYLSVSKPGKLLLFFIKIF